MKIRKIVLVITATFIANPFSFAQGEPTPYWVKSTPASPVGSNIFYVWGVGEGKDRNEAWKNAESYARASYATSHTGSETPRISVDSLRFISDLRDQIEVPGSKLYFTQNTETILIHNTNGTEKIFVLFEFIKNTQKELNYRQENHYDAECDRLIEQYNKSLILPERNWRPLGVKQFQQGTTTWETIRGGIWLAGQVGGLAGGITYGVKWSNHNKKLKGLRRELENAVYDDEERRILSDINATEKKISNSKIGFGVSVGVMGLFYGLNVIDNCIWSENDKRGVHASLYISPSVTPEYNGISLTYNF